LDSFEEIPDCFDDGVEWTGFSPLFIACLKFKRGQNWTSCIDLVAILYICFRLPLGLNVPFFKTHFLVSRLTAIDIIPIWVGW
jgi:hypothetical protein